MRRCTRVERAVSLALALAWLLAFGAPEAAVAQNHDLVMFTLDADPKPLERGCSASLFSSFLINGHMDDQLSSGDAEINFYWADGANPVPTGAAGWSSIGSLAVTWSVSDGPFAIGREWPTGFPSVATTTKSWTVPTSATSFHLKAEVVYTPAGVTDEVPGNNQAVVPNVPSVEGDCPSSSCCAMTSSGLFICSLACLGRDILIPHREFICIVKPELCRPELVRPPLCEIIDCDPCVRGLTCPPFPFPWELLIRWPDEVMRVELFAGDRLIAESKRLREPIEHQGQLFYQVIRFGADSEAAELIKKLGVEQLALHTVAGPKAEVGKLYPTPVVAREIEGKRRY